MRTCLRLGTAATLLTLLAAPAQSQGIFGGIIKKAGDAVSQKAQDKVNSKIDEMSQKMVDNTFATMFGDSSGTGVKGSGGGAGGPGATGSPFSLGNNAKTEDSYTFNVVSTMEIESSKNSDKAILKMHFNTNEAYTGTSITSADPKKAEQGNAFIVFDAKNQAMVMMMASDKKKFSIAYGWAESQKFAPAAATPKEQVNWDTVKVWKSYSKIGTKTIAGYSADGYRMDTPDGNVEMWLSHDSKLSVGNMFGASSNLKQMQGRLPADYPQGMLLQMISTNKSGEKLTMTVTSIDTNAHVTYAMSDYPKMDMGKK
jgi:uncharacterized protein DUF4412